MYGIFTYIWLIYKVNAGKYTSPMDPMVMKPRHLQTKPSQALQVASLSNWATYPSSFASRSFSCDHVEVFWKSLRENLWLDREVTTKRMGDGEKKKIYFITRPKE